MSNTLLTPNMITREALRILHQKLNFVGNINRAYDDSFAKEGAKIGNTLRIRLPNQYLVSSGPTLQVQDTVEDQVSLTVDQQKHVDTKFSSTDLTLSLDDFGKRILDPAMSVLAAVIESDAMTMYKDVYNEVSDVGAKISVGGDLGNVLEGDKKLTDNLTPTSQRSLNLNTRDNADLVNALKGLFNPNSKLSENFKEGMVADEFLGYQKVFRNTMWPRHTTGTATDSEYLVDDAAGEANGSNGLLHIDTGTGTFKKGDVIFITNVFRVHPETKQSTGLLQQFIVTADYVGGEGDLAISPSIISSGAKQNVNAGAANNAPILKRESDQTTVIGAGAAYNISMGFHKDAFTFATADLAMPKGVHFAAREVMDGISMRIVQQYDINNDTMPCRIDVLYGFKTIRPQLAVRYGFN